MAPKGGKRAGSGRPKGYGRFGDEPTKQIRVPLSRIDDIYGLLSQASAALLPLYGSKVQAGFPSPADDYIERYLDLNTEFIQHPAATFFLRATGDSMQGAGIYSGDILVVDKSLPPQDGKIVIAALDGELTVKRLSCKAGRLQLLPANPAYPVIDISEEAEFVIWGVVTLVLHRPE